jgi:creatinine amidohydrolase
VYIPLMRLPIIALVLSLSSPLPQSAPATEKGQRLENLSWLQAERILTPDAIVVLPVGAASKEHGPHLKLRNDLTLAEYLTRRVLEAAPVVVAPTLTYHHYPQFLEYPGSTSLTLATAREMTSEVVRSLTRYGPRRFYVLNTGISTIRPLEAAATALEREGVLLRYTDLRVRLDQASQPVRQQEAGSHADEVETSMMLYIEPSSVDMSKAVRDLSPSSPAIGLTRQRGGKGTYSPTGTWGDPTLATREKGRIIVEALVAAILADIQALQSAALPTAVSTAPTASPPTTAAPTTAPQEASERCSAGDERTIRAIGDAFAISWVNADAQRIGSLWSKGGDLMHPDGTVERGSEIIAQNRAQLFQRREYRATRHPLTIGNIRCLSNDIAVADGKWELRGLMEPSGKTLP